MSAFIVDKAHIDALVDLALNGPKDIERPWEGGPRWAQGDPRCTPWQEQLWSEVGSSTNTRIEVIPPSLCGAMLLAENIASIQARYPDTVAALAAAPGVTHEVEQWASEGVGSYEFTRPVHRFTAVAGLKLIDCYEYQACEHDGWDDSQAKRFCDALRGHLIGYLPGYDEAPWGL